LLFRYDIVTELDVSLLQVVVGVHKITEPEPSQRRYDIKQAVVHKGFELCCKNDIMLLQLSSRIEFNENVRPICVDGSVFPVGTQCMTTGWGSTVPSGNSTHAHTLSLLFLQDSENSDILPNGVDPKSPRHEHTSPHFLIHGRYGMHKRVCKKPHQL